MLSLLPMEGLEEICWISIFRGIACRLHNVCLLQNKKKTRENEIHFWKNNHFHGKLIRENKKGMFFLPIRRIILTNIYQFFRSISRSAFSWWIIFGKFSRFNFRLGIYGNVCHLYHVWWFWKEIWIISLDFYRGFSKFDQFIIGKTKKWNNF